MVNRILGIDFGRRSQQTQPSQHSIDSIVERKTSTTQNVTELPRPSMDHIRRPGIAALKLAKNTSKSRDRKDSKERNGSRTNVVRGTVSSPRSQSFQKPIKLDMVIESPPAIFHDPESTGYLLSGRLQVTPNAADVVMEKITMYLEATVATQRPVENRCRECATQVNDLYEWHFFTHPKTFALSQGMQELPFSHLIPGHLPITTHGHIGSIDYSLHVRARSSDGQETEFRRELVIKRALRSEVDKNSIRVFPPTNLNLVVTLPAVVHPIGAFPIMMRMTGIITKREDTQTRWRLRKLQWRIEEVESMVSPACPKHAHKVGGEGKGIQSSHSRDIGSAEIRTGFKTDFEDGMMEGEFEALCSVSANPQCDVKSPNGLEISHVLHLELVIAEEWAPNKKPTQTTPTGAARVLRTQFGLVLTQRAGMGIAWDDEQPPMYDDVPASPPQYPSAGPSSTGLVGISGSSARAEREVVPADSPPHYSRTTVRVYEGEDLHEDVESLRLSE